MKKEVFTFLFFITLAYCLEKNNEKFQKKGFDFQKFLRRLIGGSVAGFFETILLYPLIFIYTKLQMIKNDKKNEESVINIVKNVVKENGIFGLYSGAIPAIICAIPWRSVKFTALQTSRPLVGPFLACFIAAFFEGFILTPFEAIRIKTINANDSDSKLIDEGISKKKMSSFQIFVQITRKGGVFQLLKFKEYLLLFLRSATFNIGNFYTYWGVQRLFKGIIQKNILHLISGFCGGVAGIIIDNPVDVIRTRLQQKEYSKYSIKQIFNLGGMYNGVTTKIIKTGIGSAFLFFVYNFFSSI